MSERKGYTRFNEDTRVKIPGNGQAFLNHVKCKKENRELASFRDFLLPMLMNRQVTFKNIDDAK